MSNLFFHPGSSPDLFLVTCAAVSLVSALVVLRARKRRNVQRRSAHQ